MTPLTLELTGGLGNQLFSYAYARSLSRHFNLKLVLDASVTARVQGRQADLFEFVLDGEQWLSLGDYSRFEIHANRLLWRYPFTRTVSGRNQSRVLSWDLNTRRFRNGGRLRGFFQGEEALDAVNEEKEKLFALKNPSSNFMDLSQEVIEKNVTSIHVRRGDYRSYKENFGLLSASYYESAVKENHPDDSSSDIWLFSDEPDLTLSELKNVGIQVNHVVSPTELSVAETLKLMSLSKKLITANSTFSWWAGALGENIEIIAPQPWYRKEDSWLRESALIPSSWKRHPANWVAHE